jgi:hypothetical protein
LGGRKRRRSSSDDNYFADFSFLLDGFPLRPPVAPVSPFGANSILPNKTLEEEFRQKGADPDDDIAMK